MPGTELSRRFFVEAVQPLLQEGFPELAYASALLGPGSDVLGFDSAMSTDHGYGPRVHIFLGHGSPLEVQHAVGAHLRRHLPTQFAGFDVHVALPGDREPTDDRFWFQSCVLTPDAFARTYLGIDVTERIAPVEWLTLPSQKLRTIAAGPIFHESIGLEAWRQQLAWYPHDVWLYLLAAGWTRIGQEEHLMGRAGDAGDELGSAIIGARLVRDLMRLCFLMERSFAPYAKWFRSAFQQLRCAAALAPSLHSAVVATTWRERRLITAYESVATAHNALGLTEPLTPRVQSFFDRPFAAIATRGFANALAASIQDPAVRRWLDRHWIGGIDQVSDSTDVLASTTLQPAIRAFYA